ncbi:MAG: FMN-binding protein [Peptococcaceae bacterium]|nr:FMN-binding protein [Peptococcaceae bacterium]
MIEKEWSIADMNIRKKCGLLAMALVVATSLSACGQEESYDIAPSGSWTDGTYTEQVRGYHGDFSLKVVIEGGKLADIQVGDNEETPDRGGVAIKEMPKAMIKQQTYDVDGISGATKTAEALRQGVGEALEKASASDARKN